VDGLLSGSVDVFGYEVPKFALLLAAGGAALWAMKRG
jgi:hypothetical protein